MAGEKEPKGVSGGPCQNTDKEIWRERPGDFYSDSAHVTKSGAIGFNCGGYVIQLKPRKWNSIYKKLQAICDAPVSEHVCIQFPELAEAIDNAREELEELNVKKKCHNKNE